MRFLGHCTCLLALALSSAAAHAQTAYPPAAAPAPAPAAAPPPGGPAEPPLIRPYAVIKPTLIVSSAAVESFGQPNASAMTAAGNPALAPAGLEDEAFTTWQAAQSRLGFWFDEKGPVRGHFEVDFIDFGKASPTTGAVPRLRIANLDWQVSPSFLIAAGQDWDLYSPINPYTLSITAVAFQAGNTGFMRQQAKFIWHNESLELGAALGLPGANNAARLGVPEFTQLPSLAVRGAVLLGPAGRVGISAIASRWRFTPGVAATERNALAASADIYGDVTPVKGLNLRFEAYYGQNLANIGALALGQGSTTDDIGEVGGFISPKLSLSDVHAIYGLFGMAKVLDDDKVVPAYTYPAPAMPGAVPAVGTATISGTGPGMTSNMTAVLGYEYKYSKALAVQAEGFMFQSTHVLAPDDVARFDDERSAFGGELCLLLTL